MNRMNTTAIWQKIELLLEKTEHSDYVALHRDYFEEAMKDASDFAYVEIEMSHFPTCSKIAQRVGGITHALGTKWSDENRYYF